MAPAVVAMSPEGSHDDDAKASVEPVVAKPTDALTPPTSEEMNHDEPKQELHDESDLSELDLDEDDDDDGEEIEPDHYWDAENGGKIPVFKPTMEQFRSFKKFVGKIDKYGMKSGIVKVIPPKEWRDSLPSLTQNVKGIKIKNPITQEFNGAFGTYTQQNVEKQRSYNLPEWKALTEQTEHQPPAKRGERRRNQEKVVRGGGGLRGRGATATAVKEEDGPQPKKKPGRPRRNPLPVVEPEHESEEDPEPKPKRVTRGKVPPTPDSPAVKPERKKPGPKPKGKAAGGKAGQARTVASRRLNNTAELADIIDEAAFKNFDYHMDDLDEFTPERCQELETQYWKSLAFNQPMYAADMPGSLFDDSVESWNVAKLENLLDVLGTKVPGVNTAYLYMGMWKATFAWHLEDVDLYSINYIHFGAPKQWYSISQEDARKFEAAMKSVWPQDAKNCDQFLRHKTYLISPDVLQKTYGVKVNKLVHYEGEFVITYPYGYHSGYNLGYNCAESVNFAQESWLEYGRIARKCNCEADNVWVDVSEIERKLRGEPTPEYYEETDDDDEDQSDEEDGNLPSPPASVKGKAPRGKKRKRDVKEEKPLKKKKKIRIKLRTGPVREPCIMCPNDNPWEPLLPTDNGKKAHRSCALYTPETWIDKVVNEAAGTTTERICGVTSIDRARLELKCNFCRSKRGACFQCSSKKCTRAFHASCAQAAGVLVDAGMVPTFGEDGTEYFEEGYDFRCKYHRPKFPKVVNLENLEARKATLVLGRELKKDDVIQAQYIGGEVFAGLVIENRVGEMSVIVDVLPEGDRIEVEWKWLAVLDPDDSVRPQPSDAALPMPEGMNKKAVSVNNRQDGVPTSGDVFHDNEEYKWLDFFNIHTPPPWYSYVKLQAPMKLKVDMMAPDQLYHYLPRLSTEAKCFFTDVVNGKTAVPRANFIERIAAAARPRYAYQHTTARPSLSAAPQARMIGAAQHKPAPQPANTVAPPTAQRPPQPQSGFVNMPARPTSSGYDTEDLNRPYTYKPREAMRPNMMWGVDSQSLATQRNFLDQATRSGGQGYDPVRNAPLRPFPRDCYYSTEKLPASYRGQYSGFTQVVKASGAYEPQYQAATTHQVVKHGAPTVPMMMGSSPSLPPNPYASSSSRPSTAQQQQQSQSPFEVGPLTPATTAASMASSGEKSSEGQGYLDSLRKYPYLLNSYLRRDKTYESPYPATGGFAANWQPTGLDSKPATRPVGTGQHTPTTSISSVRRASQQWTPPSKIWASTVGITADPPQPVQRKHSAFSSSQPQYPFYSQSTPQQAQSQPFQAARKSQYPNPVYQTPGEWQQSFLPPPTSTASTASRDGAQARMMREQGYGPYAPHTVHIPTPSQQHVQANYGQHGLGGLGLGGAQPSRGSFGVFDTAKMDVSDTTWASPKAPTVSPLSDPNTPGVGMQYGGNPSSAGGPWSLHGQKMGAAQQQQSSGGSVGYGPTLPQMRAGEEAWRYQ